MCAVLLMLTEGDTELAMREAEAAAFNSTQSIISSKLSLLREVLEASGAPESVETYELESRVLSLACRHKPWKRHASQTLFPAILGCHLSQLYL